MASNSNIDENNSLFRERAEAVLVKMHNYYEKKQLCDVVLVAGIDGTSVPAHRLVLSASSEYFSAMFLGSMCESEKKEIRLGEVTGPALQALVRFCYNGRLELDNDNAETILATASMLQLTDAIADCCNFLLRNIDPSNCLGIAFFAEQHSCSVIQKKAEAFIIEHFGQVCKKQEFKQLSIDQLCTLIACDEINVPSEMDVFNSCISWLNHDKLSREKYIPKLLSLVRLQLLPHDFLLQHVKPLCSSDESKKRYTDALEWHLLPRKNTNLFSRQTPKPLKSNETLYAFTSRVNILDVHTYCYNTDKWVHFKTIKYARCSDYFHCVQLNNRILILNKFQFDIFDIALNLRIRREFVECSASNNFACAVLNNCFYTFGNDISNNASNAVDRWDPVTQSWCPMPPMSLKRKGLTAVGLGDYLYAIGGDSGNGPIKAVERFNINLNKWTAINPMNRARYMAAAATYNGHIYVVGGYGAPRLVEDTVERYDPATYNWTIITNGGNSIRKNVSCAFLDGRLMVLGGQYLDEYDPKTNAWSRKTTLSSFTRFQLLTITN